MNLTKDVPWDLEIASDLTETDHPTEEETDFVRRFAPAQAAGRKLMTELIVTNITKKMQQKTKN